MALAPMASAENLITNGDASDDVMIFDVPASIEGSIHEGDPAEGGAGGKPRSFALKILAENDGRPIGMSVKKPIFIDYAKSYRFRISFLSQGDGIIVAGGYVHDGESSQPLENADGRVWEYSMKTPDGQSVLKFPSTGWVDMEATVGPEGSSADFFWIPNSLRVGLGFWITAAPGTTVYVTNLSVEEIP